MVYSLVLVPVDLSGVDGIAIRSLIFWYIMMAVAGALELKLLQHGTCAAGLAIIPHNEPFSSELPPVDLGVGGIVPNCGSILQLWANQCLIASSIDAPRARRYVMR